MDVPSLSRSFQTVAHHLPFSLEATDEVNAAFRRWQQQGDAQAEYWVALWTYCFIRRYFAIKFMQDALQNSAADLDAVMERAYKRVQKYTSTINDKTRYAQWVSVVCKHTFLNYLRGRHLQVSLQQEQAPLLQAEAISYDLTMVLEGVSQAIDRLPPFLQEVARLRFLRGLSYEEIEQATGKPLPTIRSYANKALVKFRSDGQLLVFLEPSSDF